MLTIIILGMASEATKTEFQFWIPSSVIDSGHQLTSLCLKYYYFAYDVDNYSNFLIYRYKDNNSIYFTELVWDLR